MQDGSFSRAIADHVELQRRNGRLEGTLPLDRYRDQFDPGKPLPEPPASQPSDEKTQAPWDDPDSWWNVRDEPAFDWDK